MKEKNVKEETVEKTESKLERKVEQPKTEEHHCGECKYYDLSTQRDFHRDGIREGLVEVRAICRAPKDKSKASNHLVKRESVRPCFEEGTYVAPVKEKAEKKKQAKTEQKPQRKKHIRPKPNISSATNILNGKSARLETRRNGKVYVEAIA